ncbi:MAG: hypothetical protein OSA98_22265, partial [Rubripirellula sp.]|nr:hypothetical protein [Rubripirellula sp.]
MSNSIAWKPFFAFRDRFKSIRLPVLTGLKETVGRAESVATGTGAFIDQLGQTSCRMEWTISVALSHCLTVAALLSLPYCRCLT